jgi:hypothetical protein
VDVKPSGSGTVIAPPDDDQVSVDRFAADRTDDRVRRSPVVADRKSDTQHQQLGALTALDHAAVVTGLAVTSR